MSKFTFIGAAQEYKLKKKIEEKGLPLKFWGIKINYGIKTGCNEAFIIDEITRQNLIAEDPKSEELIKPLLRGRDIKRYMYSFEGQYLLFTGYDLDIRYDYPAVFSYLKRVGDRLENTAGKGKGLYKRDDQGKNWWNLRACDYYEDFEKEKVSWGNLGLKTRATTLPKGFFISAPAPLFAPANNYILSIINSKLGDWYIRQCGVSRSGGYFEYKPMFVEQLPIPKAPDNQQSQIIQIVRIILSITDSTDYLQNHEKQAQVKEYEE